MTKKSNKTIDDIINLEVSAIENKLANIRTEITKYENEIENKSKKIHQLIEEEMQCENDLEKAKKQMASLKRSVWASDNPNIVELRNQLLMTAKLVQDQEQKG